MNLTTATLVASLERRGFARKDLGIGRAVGYVLGCVTVQITDADSGSCTVTCFESSTEASVPRSAWSPATRRSHRIEWSADFHGAPAEVVMSVVAKALP